MRVDHNIDAQVISTGDTHVLVELSNRDRRDVAVTPEYLELIASADLAKGHVSVAVDGVRRAGYCR